jgi:GTP-binding protein
MTEGNFVDYVKINIASGKGGKGSTHLRREKYVAKGGPDGGDGGRGGHIILKGNSQYWTLYHLKFKRHFKAENGYDGGKNRITGSDGKDVYIDVPLGTVVKDTKDQKTIFEITDEGEEKIICEGGKGGRGNWHFKSSTNQTPRYSQPGIPNQEKQITLELKVLADVGLVGFPNAGKSTLLSVVTDAKPKIADYEFTTLKPNLGIVKYRDFRTFVMADIPGIIEGASEGKGLGHYFLRHIERNSTLLFMIPSDSDDIIESYNILLKELKKYNSEMLDKSRLVAITKCDLLDDELIAEIELEIKSKIKEDYIFISSISNIGLVELKDKVWEMLN